MPVRPRAAVDIFGLLSAPALETPPPPQLRQRRHLYAHARTRAPQPTSKAFQARRGQPDLQPSRTAGVRAAAARGSNIGRRCCGRCSAHAFRVLATICDRPNDEGSYLTTLDKVSSSLGRGPRWTKLVQTSAASTPSWAVSTHGAHALHFAPDARACAARSAPSGAWTTVCVFGMGLTCRAPGRAADYEGAEDYFLHTRSGSYSRRRDCHFDDTPCTFSRCSNRNKQGMSLKFPSGRVLAVGTRARPPANCCFCP